MIIFRHFDQYFILSMSTVDENFYSFFFDYFISRELSFNESDHKFLKSRVKGLGRTLNHEIAGDGVPFASHGSVKLSPTLT